MLPRIVGYIFPRLETVVDKTHGRETIGTITTIFEKQTPHRCVDEIVNILHFVFTWPTISSSRWYFFPWRPIWSPSAVEKGIWRGGGKAAAADWHQGTPIARSSVFRRIRIKKKKKKKKKIPAREGIRLNSVNRFFWTICFKESVQKWFRRFSTRRGRFAVFLFTVYY